MTKENTASHAHQNTVGREKARACAHSEFLGGSAGGGKGLGAESLEGFGYGSKNLLLIDENLERDSAFLPVGYALHRAAKPLGYLGRPAEAFDEVV